jgi:hypothetical protein
MHTVNFSQAPCHYPYDSQRQKSLLMLSTRPRNSEDKINNDSRKQRQREDGGSISIIKPALPSLSYTLRSPVEREQRVDHGRHRNQCEQSGTNLSHSITKV